MEKVTARYVYMAYGIIAFIVFLIGLGVMFSNGSYYHEEYYNHLPSVIEQQAPAIEHYKDAVDESVKATEVNNIVSKNNTTVVNYNSSIFTPPITNADGTISVLYMLLLTGNFWLFHFTFCFGRKIMGYGQLNVIIDMVLAFFTTNYIMIIIR